jgi:16S rRNA (cytosine967-C5)-methyltransferase
MKTPIKKTAPFTLSVLRSALYQIMYMDKIPDSAAVNEAVKLIKKSKESRNAGFVNAVLRSALRSERALPDGIDSTALSIKYSCPLWIIDSFISDYSTNTAVNLLEESLNSPPVVLRVNTVKTTTEELMEMLKSEGITVSFADTDNALILEKGNNIEKSKAYKNGLFYIQDTASQKAVAILSPKPDERVLDICSAPGGKSFLMAQLMENKGEIVSCDLYEHKIKLIKTSAERLGLDIITPEINDATVFNPDLGKFDTVLCDVPCSGLGVIRRKPEIKYKSICDFSELEKIQ